MKNDHATKTGRIILSAIISFVITVILAAMIFAKLQIRPGGNFTILSYDLAWQYLPFISSLRYVGKGDCSYMFSMFGGLGVSYLANLAYYAANPLNLLTVFVPLAKLPDAIYFIVLFKLGAASVAFYIYTVCGLKVSKHNALLLLLSISYGLSSYNIFYSMSIMWLDGVILLPFILLGVELMLKKKKIAVYIPALTASLYLNYYITYMSGIFVCLYLIYRLIVSEYKKEDIKDVILRFGFSSMISIGLSMPLILPAIMYTLLGKTSEVADQAASVIRVTPLRIFRNLFPFGEHFIFSGGAPQLHSSIAVVVLVVGFFFMKNVSLKEKVTVIAICAVYFLSFLLVPIDRVWHGFRDPICFPARYSYTFIAFMIIVAVRMLEMSGSDGLLFGKSLKPALIYTLMFIAVCGELILNGHTVIMDSNNTSRFVSSAGYEMNVRKHEQAINSIDDRKLYRVITSDPFTQIDGFMFGFNDISYFSSAYNHDLHSYMRSMGCCNDRHELSDQGITPVMASLLGVKYYIGNGELYYDSRYVSGQTPYGIYQNTHLLSIGYLADSPKPSALLSDDDPFANQEVLLSQLLGNNVDIYRENSYTIKDVVSSEYARSSNIDLTIDHNGPVYMYFPVGTYQERLKYDIDTDLTIYNYLTGKRHQSVCTINNEQDYNIMRSNSAHCVYIGDHTKGDHLSLSSYSTTYYHDPVIVTLDADSYTDAINKLAENQLTITRHEGGTIEGSINGIAGKSLVVTIPYMDGYSVFVDGVKRAYDMYNPAMISIPINEGAHTIRIEYTSPGLIPGLVIGIMSLIILLGYEIAKRRHPN